MNTDESSAAVSQPPAAEGEGQSVAEDYAAFLGPPSVEADLSEETPAPEGREPGSDAEPELSGEAEPEQEAQAEQEVEAEAEPEQPPSVEDRLQDLTQRELDQYAQRYPSAWRALQDPKTPEDLKHLLLDKIDGDHEIQRRIAEEQAFAEQQEEEPTLEYEQPQVQQSVQATPEALAQQRTAYYQGIDNLIQQNYDQQSVKEVGDTLLRMFNVRTEALNDPNVSPEDKAILQGLVASVQREAPVLARYMTDAVATSMPHFIRPALEMAVPGFSDWYERNMYAQAYESIRQQTDERGKPVYPDLPAYPAVRGTAEARAFSQKLREASEAIPGFDDMVFRDQHGRLLPEQQQAQLKYQMLARAMSGQRVNPAAIAEAVETGKRLASRADQGRATGRITGAGRSSAGLQSEADEDEDPMMAALDAEIARQERGYTQPIRGRRGR
jgi:hypothetical protein